MAQTDSFERSDIKIESKTPGWNLDAWKYLPKAVGIEPKGLPVVVMYGPHRLISATSYLRCCDARDRAHGISANKRMGLDEYAAAFAALGYGAVVFDYRRWGTSGTVE